jgi:hypothetical protein
MTDLKWEERYDGTRWFSNGVFHVVGAFEDAERLGSPYLYYVVTDVDWDEANTVGDGLKTPEDAMALAQRLQNAFDGRSIVLTKESLEKIVTDVIDAEWWDTRDTITSGVRKLQAAILAAQSEHGSEYPETEMMLAEQERHNVVELATYYSAADDAPEANIEPGVTRAQIVDALQSSWGEFCTDTGCIPDCFRIHGPKTTQVSADFGVGNFATFVTDWLNAILAAQLNPISPAEGVGHE